MAALQGWAAGAGASSAYLQVAAGNGPALALYRRAGFIEHHRYHYRRRPA
jgi:ribosomal protein S18 acetylase RimI-like enzyme